MNIPRVNKSTLVRRLDQRGCVRKTLATVGWTEKRQIRSLHKYAKELTKTLGVPMEVDHIVPLKHPEVCGLHVLANLQVISRDENIRKGNSFNDSSPRTPLIKGAGKRMGKHLKSVPVIREKHEVTEEHLTWLYQQMLRLQKRWQDERGIPANRMVQYLGRTLKKDAMREALTQLEVLGQVTISRITVQRTRRRETTTWYKPIVDAGEDIDFWLS